MNEEIIDPKQITEIECFRCLGCGKIADSEDGEPWIYWLPPHLEPPANIAVVMGIVKPVECYLCKGSGKIEIPEVKS